MTLFVHVEKCTFNRMYKYFFSETLQLSVCHLSFYDEIKFKLIHNFFHIKEVCLKEKIHINVHRQFL